MQKKAQELANSQYKELCLQYGDLMVRSNAISKDLAATLAAIESLNSQVPLMLKLEDSLIPAGYAENKTRFAENRSDRSALSEVIDSALAESKEEG